MAICKIIPIGQAKGIKQCKDYIADENKVISVKKDEANDASIFNPSQQQSKQGREPAPLEFKTVLAYMKNDEKTHRADDVQKKYISGYLCSPETAVQEFLNAKEANLRKQNKTLVDETGNWAYHIIQSFPEGLKISDDEVHQCGIELCEKLDKYQAVICSHVHPVVNDGNEITGKCKHNHILLNSHMHKSKIDPEKPDVYKYHDCKETYEQLQKWNDEISLEHGLPIIRNPDMGKKYSWYKSKKENEGTSWTQQVARDIKNTMRFCTNWEEFKKQMVEQGYFIRDTGKTVTYYSPEHSESHRQQVRDRRLGRECTKAELERYWRTIAKAKDAPTYGKARPSKARLIHDLAKQYGSNFYASVTITSKKERPYVMDVQIDNPRYQRTEDSIRTYFEANEIYDLCTDDGAILAQVSGQDLFDYYEMLRKEREKREKKDGFNSDTREKYYDKTKKNSKTKVPYTISMWDETGRRRTEIELKCLLAVIIIKNEHVETTNPPAFIYRGPDGKYLCAKTDWKIQNMYNAMAIAKDLHVDDANDVARKLDRAGKEVARLRKQENLLTEQFNQMVSINQQLEAMEAVQEICEEIYKIPDGEEKTAATQTYAAQLAQYTAAKRYLHTKNINNQEQIVDFKRRYHSTEIHLKEVQEDFARINQEYRNLKKIDYNLKLAQNDYYCYGPEHPMFEGERASEKNNQNLNGKMS